MFPVAVRRRSSAVSRRTAIHSGSESTVSMSSLRKWPESVQNTVDPNLSTTYIHIPSLFMCEVSWASGSSSHTESGCILPSMSEKRNSEELESARLEALYRKASDPVLRTHLF